MKRIDEFVSDVFCFMVFEVYELCESGLGMDGLINEWINEWMKFNEMNEFYLKYKWMIIFM